VGSARNVWGLSVRQRFVRGPVGESVPTKTYMVPPENMVYMAENVIACNYENAKKRPCKRNVKRKTLGPFTFTLQCNNMQTGGQLM
jgi:hypothetical protein